MAALADYAVASSIPARRSRRRSFGVALSHEWPDEALAAKPLTARAIMARPATSSTTRR
jgi:hypothetical protein